MLSRMHVTVLAALTIGLASCGGGDDDSTNPVTGVTTPVHVISATVNGVAFTPTTISGGYSSGTFVLSGTNGTASITISGQSLSGAGTYSLTNPNPQSATALYTDGTGIYQTASSGGSGQLILTTAVLGHVKGSFDFTATYNPSGQTITSKRLIGTFDVTVP